ncbi:TIGR04283 family arsenosugar biosynthesis glycosyltransferase [Fodinicurvata halophila]|uniref:TIGR04283 family arsenosugar biosynthesis glycosyltransferase n=1 Tax=Fodinicurvata halophila TaxID=1419723 RepID=A0ABV8UIC7_9PROT
MPGLSLIIPTYNAAERLRACLDSLKAGANLTDDASFPVELIISDGGSTDGTRQLARERGCRLLDGPPGRGRQLRTAAEAANGEWLFFLHADSRLPPDWMTALRRFMSAEGSRDTAGYGRLRLDSNRPAARRVERLANWRAARLGLPYGDQGLLIARTTYEAVGGYRDIPLMEDVDLVRRLGRARLRPLAIEIVTAADKYEQQGWWKRPCLNLCRLTLYLLGVPERYLARGYR